MYPFDFERAKKGHLLITRNGKDAICFKEDYNCLTAIVEGQCQRFSRKGEAVDNDSNYDLFMKYESRL